MLYACKSLHCKEVFQSARGLTTHRASCEHYKRHEAAACKRRKELACEDQARRHKALEKAREQLGRKQNQVSSLRLSIKCQVSKVFLSPGAHPNEMPHQRTLRWISLKLHQHHNPMVLTSFHAHRHHLLLSQKLADQNGTTAYQPGMKMCPL